MWLASLKQVFDSSLFFLPKSKVTIILIIDIYMSSLDPLQFIPPIQLWHLLGKSTALPNVIILNSSCQTSRHISSSSRPNCLSLPLLVILSSSLIFIPLMTFIGTTVDQKSLGCNILRIQQKTFHTFKSFSEK